FVMGEGAGVLVLKRLSDALDDGDDVRALIRGIGGSSDGHGKGITAPHQVGQKLAVKRAYEDAGYGPKSVSLFEAHGTSTPIGDPAEFQSTCDVYAEDSGPRAVDQPSIGSVKSMIGHLKSGAGAASLIKTAFALEENTLPPTLNVENPHPDLKLDERPFRIQHTAEDWELSSDLPRRAGVSAFGFGGTNFHITLEEFDPGRIDGGDYVVDNSAASFGSSASGSAGGPSAGASSGPAASGPNLDDPDLDAGLLSFTGDTERELQKAFEQFAENFRDRGVEAVVDHRVDLRRQAARDEHSPPSGDYRLAVAYGSEDELDQQVDRIEDSFERGKGWNILENQGIYRGEESRDGDIAMLFPGQGTQYLGMLNTLRELFPSVDAVFEEADRVMEPVYGEPLTDIIDPPEHTDEAKERLQQTQYTQPAVLTADVALLKLLERFGIEPDMVAGHSLGEYGALVAGGVMPFEDALRTVARRGTAMADASPMNNDNGLMASIPAPPDEVEAELEKIDGYVVCANKNCPRQTIIAGLTEPVENAVEMFEEQGHLIQYIDVSHAFHSKVVADAKEPLRGHLDDLDIGAPDIPVSTNVDAGYHPDDPAEIRDLLAEQIASPVEWMSQIEQMYEDGARVFLEVGPKSALTTFSDSILDEDYLATHTNHPKEGGDVSLYRAIGLLWAEGVWSDERTAEENRTAEGSEGKRTAEDSESSEGKAVGA
ncbi:MAG: acyltransferase domain-containing protein, partial [Bradymonadaceae bacterium]